MALLQQVAPPSQLPLLTSLGSRADHASSVPAQWEPDQSRSCPLPTSCPGTGRPPLSRAPLRRTPRPQAPALAGWGARDRIFQKQSPAPKKARVHKVASAGDLATSVLPRPFGDSGELRATVPLLGLPAKPGSAHRLFFSLAISRILHLLKHSPLLLEGCPQPRAWLLLMGLPLPSCRAPRAATGAGALSRWQWPWGSDCPPARWGH